MVVDANYAVLWCLRGGVTGVRGWAAEYGDWFADLQIVSSRCTTAWQVHAWIRCSASIASLLHIAFVLHHGIYVNCARGVGCISSCSLSAHAWIAAGGNQPRCVLTYCLMRRRRQHKAGAEHCACCCAPHCTIHIQLVCYGSCHVQRSWGLPITGMQSLHGMHVLVAVACMY
jgi:hypothetical protein